MMNLLVISNIAVGFAPPSLTEPIVVTAPQPTDAPQWLVVPGLAFGADEGGVYLDPTVEVDYRIHGDWLYAHGKLVTGDNFGIDEHTNSGSRVAVNAGLEARPCIAYGVLCANLGIDAGLRYAHLDTDYNVYDGTAAMLTERVGIDIGSKHFRLRSDFQIQEGSDGGGAALTAGIGYAW